MERDEKEREELWKGVAAPLEAAYAAAGPAALDRMSGVEPLFLGYWKAREYERLGKQLEAQPGDASLRQRREKLRQEVDDIGSWIKGKQREIDRAAARDASARPPVKRRELDMG